MKYGIKRIVSILAAVLFSGGIAGAQALTYLCIPDGSEELVLGAFCRDRFESNLTRLSGSLWGLKTLEAKNAFLSQTLNFGKWSFDLSGKAYLSRKYDITNPKGVISGSFQPYDISVSLGATRKLGERIAVGVAGKFCHSVLARTYASNAFAADIHAEYLFRHGLLGIAVCNLGTPIKFGSTVNKLPLTLRAGGFWVPVESLRLSGSADFVLEGSHLMLTAGARYTLKNIVFAQAGYHFAATGQAPVPSYASAGLGVHIAGFELSAVVLFASEVLKLTPSVTLSYSF